MPPCKLNSCYLCHVCVENEEKCIQVANYSNCLITTSKQYQVKDVCTYFSGLLKYIHVKWLQNAKQAIITTVYMRAYVSVKDCKPGILINCHCTHLYTIGNEWCGMTRHQRSARENQLILVQTFIYFDSVQTNTQTQNTCLWFLAKNC